MNALISTEMKTMSSREIAELTGKRHDHVMRDIRKLKEQLGEDFKKRKFIDGQNIARFEFLIDDYHSSLLLARYKGLARVPNRLQEEAALKAIEQILGVKLIRQFRVLSYRVDGYDADANIAYEIDEPNHRHQTIKDLCRQRKIEDAIGCKFIRITL